MPLLTLFCVQIYFINHFIFSEFKGVFPFIHDYVATILQSFKILFFTFSYYFFISLATMIGMVPGDCYFYVCCVNFYFLRKKKFIVVLWMHLWPKQICYFLTYFRKIKHLEKMYFFQKQTNKQTNERANKQTNKPFLDFKLSVKKILQLGGFDLHLPFWIIQVPFCQTRWPFIKQRALFQEPSDSILHFKLKINYFFKFFIWNTFITYFAHNEVYVIKSEQWLWKIN